MRRTEELTRDHKNARLNVCLCYSSKEEIVQAVEATAEQAGKLASQSNDKQIRVTQADFESNLYGGFNCKPEILIRTSNEIRMSNFLLYQTDGGCQYQFIEALWPDFSVWDFTKIII
jgi:undecaprenyl diphosphate synthase